MISFYTSCFLETCWWGVILVVWCMKSQSGTNQRGSWFLHTSCLLNLAPLLFQPLLFLSSFMLLFY